MGDAILFLTGPIIIIGLVAFGISRVVRARLIRTGNPHTTAITITTFVLSFVLIVVAIIAALSTVEWGR
jgi:hypothetical protein